VSRTSKILIGVAIVALLVAAWVWFPLGEWLRTTIEWVDKLGVVGLLAFCVVFIAVCLTPLPSQMLYLGAGVLYGWLWGGLLTMGLGLVVELCALGIMHTGARRWIERRRDKHKTLKALDRGISAHSFWILLLLRLSPLVPFGSVNYALALTKIPVWQRLVTNALGMLPNCLMFAYVGSMLSSAADLDGAEPPGPWKYVVLVVGVATVAGASLAAAWATKRALHAEPSQATA
jgi:uncharacterized membrane protein YdjX (TVP38/TMEM64 family)